MGRVRIRCHQRFYGFDITIHRCKHQRRHLLEALGGEGVDGWGMVGIEEEAIRIYRVRCVCVCMGKHRETVRRIKKERSNNAKKVTPTPSLHCPYNPHHTIHSHSYDSHPSMLISIQIPSPPPNRTLTLSLLIPPLPTAPAATHGTLNSFNGSLSMRCRGSLIYQVYLSHIRADSVNVYT